MKGYVILKTELEEGNYYNLAITEDLKAAMTRVVKIQSGKSPVKAVAIGTILPTGEIKDLGWEPELGSSTLMLEKILESM